MFWVGVILLMSVGVWLLFMRTPWSARLAAVAGLGVVRLVLAHQGSTYLWLDILIGVVAVYSIGYMMMTRGELWG